MHSQIAMFIYALIILIHEINVRNESIIAVLERKLLKITNEVLNMHF